MWSGDPKALRKEENDIEGEAGRLIKIRYVPLRQMMHWASAYLV